MQEKLSEQFKNIKYQNGFGHGFESQAKEGVLPVLNNSPIKLKYGVFAQQLSGTAFTVKRAVSQKAWLYKMRPSAIQTQYKQSEYPYTIVGSYLEESQLQFHPNQLMWKPIPSITNEKKTFIQGLVSVAGAGQPSLKEGIAIYIYSANASMEKTSFYSSDGDFLIVPYLGKLYITTEMGKMVVQPFQICVIPRGIKFTIDLQNEIKGWVAQVFGNHLNLPQLGPIGANGLANPKDFQYPVSWFDQCQKKQWKIVNKYIGKMFESEGSFSPYNVVGWRGNYAPYKYDLRKFNTIGSISFDHPDPSIFTVLTSPSDKEGMAALDFVIFPPRWLVQENTFKPPYFHRNCMSQFMGNIAGQYDAKKGDKFQPGGSSLHSCMTPHGPDTQSYENFVKKTQHHPYKIPQTNMAFMFESGFLLKTTKYAFNMLQVDKDYYKGWERLSEIKYQA